MQKLNNFFIIFGIFFVVGAFYLLANKKPVVVTQPTLGSQLVQWIGTNATSTRIAITTATSVVMSANFNRHYGRIANDTSEQTISCEYGLSATSLEGHVLRYNGTASSSENEFVINSSNPWWGPVTCVASGNASATLVEY